MAEKLLTSPEHHEALPAPERQERLSAGPEVSNAGITREQGERLSEARQQAQAEAQTVNPVEKIAAANETEQPAAPQHINRELKQITLRRELNQIRRKLGAPQRTLSRVVHQPAVRAVSEAAGKTVSRPSGLLGGGLLAFLGTSGYLYLARHIGFQYNYGVFLVLFAGGFALGLALEFLVHAASASRRRKADL